MSVKANFDFQAMIRSAECKAALTVYEKYRRKFGLSTPQLRELHAYAIRVAFERAELGKPSGKDILIQETSAHCKRIYGNAA